MAKKSTLLTKLKLSELSLVDKGANQFASITISKRFVENPVAVEIKKYYSEYEVPKEAMDFKAVLDENTKHKKLYAARDELYPLFNALNASITSIATDTKISDTDRTSKIDESVSNFLSAVKGVLPEVDDELQKMFEEINAGTSTGSNPTVEDTMATEIEKKLAEVEKALTEKTEALAKAEKTMADLKAEEEKKAKEDELKKSDETVEIAGQTIRKSAVGAETFAVMKSQAEEIKKANERISKAEEAAEMAKLEKRASEEFAFIPGTDAEKASLLKFLGSDAEKGKAVEALLKSLNDKNEPNFKSVGVNKTADSAVAQEAKIAEIQKRDNISKSAAMEKAVSEAPELFK